MDWITNIGAALGGGLIGILIVKVFYMKKEISFIKRMLRSVLLDEANKNKAKQG